MTDPRMGWADLRSPPPEAQFVDEQCAVWTDSGRRFFSMKEWLVLKYLRSHPNMFCSKDAIESWLYSGRGDWPASNSLCVCVSSIRKKIRGTGYVIRTHYGAGYMWERE